MKVKELIEKLQKLNSEYDVKVVAYNESAGCSKKCNITDANALEYYNAKKLEQDDILSSSNS